MEEEGIEFGLEHFERMGNITNYFVFFGKKRHVYTHVGNVDITISFRSSWVYVVAMGMGKLRKQGADTQGGA
jgi:hypothetical protein